MEMTPELSNLIGMAFLAGALFTVVGGWIIGVLADIALALIRRRRAAAEAPDAR